MPSPSASSTSTRAKLVAYGGNYDRFEQIRREKMELAAKAASKQLEQRRKLQAFIDRFRAKATKAAQAQSRDQDAGTPGTARLA